MSQIKLGPFAPSFVFFEAHKIREMEITEPSERRGIVLFGPGAGGNPGRYSSILGAFVTAGYVVLAPSSAQFDPRSVTTEQLQSRVKVLRSALTEYGDPDLPVIAAGHSVGAWAALCLAGAQPWGRDGRAIAVQSENRVSRLILFAPTVGWFQAPGALDDVFAPMIVHVGTADTVTPSATAELLCTTPSTTMITPHDNVGHYDFMTDLPPNITPTVGLDHDTFLQELSAQIAITLS